VINVGRCASLALALATHHLGEPQRSCAPLGVVKHALCDPEAAVPAVEIRAAKLGVNFAATFYSE